MHAEIETVTKDRGISAIQRRLEETACEDWRWLPRPDILGNDSHLEMGDESSTSRVTSYKSYPDLRLSP
jgi:hypothetical protein